MVRVVLQWLSHSGEAENLAVENTVHNSPKVVLQTNIIPNHVRLHDKDIEENTNLFNVYLSIFFFIDFY